MTEHVPDDLAVIVDDQHHWDRIAEGENDADKETRIERVRQVVEGAGCQVALCKHGEMRSLGSRLGFHRFTLKKTPVFRQFNATFMRMLQAAIASVCVCFMLTCCINTRHTTTNACMCWCSSSLSNTPSPSLNMLVGITRNQ